MKILSSHIAIVIVTCVLLVAGCRNAGKWLIKEDKPLKAAAIIVLMGSVPDRAVETADLYIANLAPVIIMVKAASSSYKVLEERGVYLPGITENTFDALTSLGVPADSIHIIPGDATDTKDEAIIVSEYIRNRPDLDTLLLVTSPQHTRRACMIFKQAFKSSSTQVKICCIPSEYSQYRAERWWTRKSDIQSVMLEYLKMINFVLFEKRQIRKIITNENQKIENFHVNIL